MTYRAHLEQLLDAAIQKAEIYFKVGEESSDKSIPLDGANSGTLKIMHDEWQAAKNAYYTFLHFLESNKIRLDDRMPD